MSASRFEKDASAGSETSPDNGASVRAHASGSGQGTIDVPASDKPQAVEFHKDIRFWAIFIALGFAGLLTALEATITSTALPSIINDLNGAEQYIWANNGYFLAM